ncbi:hypothetical protein [Nocardioides lianchengensis]|uniref:Uncharacterized protein n=1 Tax=Nocardioides lianchengensis TaxID=1045774 RepID=A0A1G6LP81_9ACTN|nr:hypothetical protein [Nocardioides lianchengensis]NYG12487.1 hypothetical protein [Nocardioides lianchengensis]SDC45082.1 hypothetical protein SAMN05421872_102318 [Nocardioides lianchengensis]
MTARFDALIAPGVVTVVVDVETARDLADGLEFISTSGGIPAADINAAAAHVAYLRKAAQEASDLAALPPAKPARHLKVAGGDPT